VDYTDQVLRALSYAHQRNVIHRDIKPSNMMLTPKGVVKLMDFGIARSGEDRSLTITGTTLGSLGYMSPEQVKGETADARSDLYSVGISLYEMVTGQRPFQGDSDYAIMAAQIKEMPRPPIELQPGLAPALNEIILLAIAKEPAQRFQTADAFRNALGSIAAGSPMRRAAAAGVVADSSEQVTLMDTAFAGARMKDARAPASGSPSAPQPPRTMADTGSQSLPAAPPQTAPSRSKRGLYIVLGAFLAIGSLAAAEMYVRKAKAQPETGSTPQQVSPEVPAPPAAAAPTVTPSEAPPPQQQGADNQEAERKARAEEAARKARQQQLDALEREADQLSGRAEAVNSSLDRLQQQQNAAGYGLRGDMAARQSNMKANLAKAQDAVGRGDIDRAKRYLELAQSDAEALERFLGH
jgi:serine/threonine-protein kinase